MFYININELEIRFSSQFLFVTVGDPVLKSKHPERAGGMLRIRWKITNVSHEKDTSKKKIPSVYVGKRKRKHFF